MPLFRKKFTLGSRIYFSMIALILFSLLITGVVTIAFFKNQNDTYHLERLKRKEQSVVLGLKYFVAENHVSAVDWKLKKKLDELSNIHGLDFHLYNEFGTLVYSTLPEDNQEPLAKPSISSALIDSIVHSDELIVKDEMYDNQQFLSSYFMIQDQNNNPIAVVNMPYLKDSKRTTTDLNDFLNSLAQVFLLLFVAASALAYFLSNYITKSLQRLSEGIKKTKLSAQNPHIEWNSDDEIGELITDYNLMVDEIRKSAELLAKSEREMAWKEMARQVAHEIKNPLTPMRLNIQHLQRSISDPSVNVQERIDQFTKLMLEQIDTLSRIASEFSNFAKMPQPVLESIDLEDVVLHSVEWYKNTPHVEVKFENNVTKKTFIQADRKQLIRALNNLIKNAIQAIPTDVEGEVMVILDQTNSQLVLSISDNGVGIPDSEKSKIFQPYFTTKSAGTGLGLAMVKNILNEFGAKISFTSETGKGTTFMIVFG